MIACLECQHCYKMLLNFYLLHLLIKTIWLCYSVRYFFIPQNCSVVYLEETTYILCTYLPIYTTLAIHTDLCDVRLVSGVQLRTN